MVWLMAGCYFFMCFHSSFSQPEQCMIILKHFCRCFLNFLYLIALWCLFPSPALQLLKLWAVHCKLLSVVLLVFWVLGFFWGVVMSYMYLELFFTKADFDSVLTHSWNIFHPRAYLKPRRLTLCSCLGSVAVQHLLGSNLCYFLASYLSPSKKLFRIYFLFMDLPLLAFCNFPFSHRFFWH